MILQRASAREAHAEKTRIFLTDKFNWKSLNFRVELIVNLVERERAFSFSLFSWELGGWEGWRELEFWSKKFALSDENEKFPAASSHRVTAMNPVKMNSASFTLRHTTTTLVVAISNLTGQKRKLFLHYCTSSLSPRCRVNKFSSSQSLVEIEKDYKYLNIYFVCCTIKYL